MGILLTMGLARYAAPDRFQLMIRSFFNPMLLQQHAREERGLNRITLLLLFMSLCSMSFFVAKALSLNGAFEFLAVFSKVLPLLILISLVRYALYTGLANLFEVEALLHIHNFQWSINNIILSFAILPIGIFLTFGPEGLKSTFVLLGIAALSIFYIVRSLRLFTLMQSEGSISAVHNVLYFCALEFLPPIILAVAVVRKLAA